MSNKNVRFPVTVNELIELGEKDNGRQIELRLHQSLRIALSEVRTSGFRWNLRKSKERVFSLVEDKVQAQGAGAGGAAIHHWVFRAEEAGLATILLECSRPWEPDAAPARTFSLSVRVT